MSIPVFCVSVLGIPTVGTYFPSNMSVGIHKTQGYTKHRDTQITVTPAFSKKFLLKIIAFGCRKRVTAIRPKQKKTLLFQKHPDTYVWAAHLFREISSHHVQVRASL